MKKTPVLAVLTLVGVLTLTAIAAVAEDRQAFRAGTAAVDISPTVFPIQLRSGPSRHVHDPLHVRAIAFENGQGRAVIAVVDAIGVDRETCDEAKAVASKQCGIPAEKMLVASTHTHTAPPSNVKQGSAPEVAYRKLLVAGIAESIVRAHAALRPAGVGAAGGVAAGGVIPAIRASSACLRPRPKALA